MARARTRRSVMPPAPAIDDVGLEPLEEAAAPGTSQGDPGHGLHRRLRRARARDSAFGSSSSHWRNSTWQWSSGGVSVRIAGACLGAACLAARNPLARFPGVIASSGSDVTLFQRELLSTVATLECLTRRPRVLDVDDAIWLERAGHPPNDWRSGAISLSAATATSPSISLLGTLPSRCCRRRSMRIDTRRARAQVTPPRSSAGISTAATSRISRPSSPHFPPCSMPVPPPQCSSSPNTVPTRLQTLRPGRWRFTRIVPRTRGC